MKKYLIIILALSFLQLGYSQNRDKRYEKIESQKVAFFTKQLDLSPQESQAFWPVYNRYQEKQKTLRENNRLDLRNKNMSEEEASDLIDAFFTRQEKELDFKKQLYRELDGILPPTKLVKLQFAEHQFKQRLLESIKNRRENKGKRPK